MHITTLGIDVAKNVFQLHGVDARGRAVLRQFRNHYRVGSSTTRQAPEPETERPPHSPI